MQKKIAKEIDRITKKIVKVHKPEKVILFGSYAWGAPTKDSDLDFFIIKKTRDAQKTAREIDGALFPREFPMDILVSTPQRVKQRLAMGDPFFNRILSKGKILYEQKK